MHRKSLDPGFHLFPGDSFRAKRELSSTRVDWHGHFLPSQSTLHRQPKKVNIYRSWLSISPLSGNYYQLAPE